jgi:hypothetical protein
MISFTVPGISLRIDCSMQQWFSSVFDRATVQCIFDL